MKQPVAIISYLALLHWTSGSPSEDAILRSSITKHNYQAELHRVITADGYKLTMVRIPGRGPPVFLMHGIFSSSVDYCVLGRGRALPFLLSDAGYDVWLGNARGNTFSRSHVHLDPSKSKFWNFSFHEIGFHDLPAMIDKALRVSGQKRVHYIGHSQGTTTFLVMAIRRPTYRKKIASAHLLAPVAYLSHMKSPIPRFASAMLKQLELAAAISQTYEVLGRSSILVQQTCQATRDGMLPTELVSIGVFALSGFYSDNQTLMGEILENTPAGSSLKQLVHYGQLANSDRFAMFDYGARQNLQCYRRQESLSYKLELATVPIAIYYGDDDWLVSKPDRDRLLARLPNVILSYRINDSTWNHLDFLFAQDADKLLYRELIATIRRLSV